MINDGMEYNPYAMGIPHPSESMQNVWVYESPSIRRLPKARILYKILDEEKEVLLSHVSFLK